MLAAAQERATAAAQERATAAAQTVEVQKQNKFKFVTGKEPDFRDDENLVNTGSRVIGKEAEKLLRKEEDIYLSDSGDNDKRNELTRKGKRRKGGSCKKVKSKKSKGKKTKGKKSFRRKRM
jgi:hypothetical protein